MAKVKVVNTRLDSNLNGINFNNTPSQTIFSFGSFAVTSNFEGRVLIDYTNELSSFVRAVTLETMGVTEIQSTILHNYSVNTVLNLDKSDLNTFVRFGSAYEFLRNTVETIILNYPGSLFVNSQTVRGGNSTFINYNYNVSTNTATFDIPTGYTVNKFGLIFNYGNQSIPDNVKLKNLNLSYTDYIVWSAQNSTGNSYSVIGFTGCTPTYQYLKLKVSGNPFPTVTGTSDSIDFHIKPNNLIFEEFRALLTDYQKYIISERLPVTETTLGFKFILKDPTLLEDGSIVYTDSIIIWSTGDKYNIDIDTPNYRKFLDIILTIGSKYDAIKTDLIARFLTPASLKTYDLTEEGKMTKLLRVYGWEFDQLRKFIDSLVHINRITYDKVNNIPDQLIRNLARTFGWNYFSLVNENELVESFLTIDDEERNLNTDLLPAEIDIELWRRILINTNYFWKSKGTREVIKSMFLLIGIPEPFINITEYVYTIDSKINPNSVTIALEDFPTQSLPYDNDGYPVAPVEANNFYFQISGDTDSGQAYMNIFRSVGFNLSPTVDNKKSWLQAGATTRIDDTTPQYYQEDSKLVLNTKEVDIALDTARGIEYDVWDYIAHTDFPANSSGYTLPYKYVNISLGVSASQNTFTLPVIASQLQGDWEVRFNGILLNAPKEFSGTTTGSTYVETGSTDYFISGNTFTLNGVYAQNNGYRRDVVQATYIYTGATAPISGISVQYLVTRIKPALPYTIIYLPSSASGDVQITINGIALTKTTAQFIGDYTVNPSDTTQILISNPEIISYLAVMNQSATNAYIQVAYVNVIGSSSIAARSELYRIDSFSAGKVYYNSTASKYVYKLNYKVNNVSEIKLLIDGIGLEPGTDYSINVSNPYEIFLPNGLKYGSVITAYYLVGGSDYFAPVIGDTFGVGDISQLSFLEFIELIQRRMINVRNRKTISDFKGGWYPTLLNVYVQYLQRAGLDPTNPLLSNGYTFENLYSFLSKYNAFFQKFVDQLLSATIILKKGGLLIRNSVFTKQKFMYKRGVNLYADGSTIFDVRGFPIIQYLGDDGSEFILSQNITAPLPPTLYVETTPGVLGSLITGGRNIIGYNILTEYGIQYKEIHSPYYYGVIDYPIGLENLTEGEDFEYTEGGENWSTIALTGNLSVNHFSVTTTDLAYSTTYQYRAYIKSGTYGYTGNTLQIITPAPPAPPSLKTISATLITTSGICNTGGYDINGWENVDWHGMKYRAIGTVGEFSDLTLSPTALTYTSAGGLQNITICGEPTNSFTISKPLLMTWATTEAPEPPAPLGIIHGITATANAGGARSGLICYTPTVGTMKCVCVSQAAYVPTSKTVSMYCCTGGYGVNGVDLDILACGAMETYPAMVAGECYYASLKWHLSKAATSAPYEISVCLLCNGAPIGYGCMVLSKLAKTCNGTWASRCFDYNDVIEVRACASAQTDTGMPSVASVTINTITSGVGSFVKGSTPTYMVSVRAETKSLLT